MSLGAVALSTLGIQASDMLRGIEGNMLGSLMESGGPCGEGAVQLLLGARSLCVDVYEASPGELCPHNAIAGESDTLNNMTAASCVPVSEAGVQPWRYVSFTQAQQLCARSGKRLPTNEEWYKAVSGLSDVSTCAIDTSGSPLLTGEAKCASPLGVHDLVGNVWEWIDEEVIDGTYNERELPPEGYVSAVDTDGVVSVTDSRPNEEYGDDYAWTKETGVNVMIRGGFYGSRSDAGLYAINSSLDTNFRTAGVGFRCVRDL